MKKIIFTTFLLLIIGLKFSHPYLSFWKSNIYLSEFDKTFTVLEKTNNDIDRFLLDGVVDYQVENQYLLVLSMVILTHDTSVTYTGISQYWAIEYSTGRKFGPFSRDGFNKFLSKNQLGKNNLSIPDSYWNYCTKQCRQANNL